MGAGIKPRGKSIALAFQYRGMQCRETIKIKPNKANLKYVAGMKAEIERKIAIGVFRYSEYFPDSHTKAAKLFGNVSSSQTVKQAVTRYLASISRNLASSTHKEYRSSVRVISAGLGDYAVNTISTTIIREWINKLDCSSKRINNILVPLRGMFKDLFADGIIERDPMARIRNMSITKYEPEPFSQAELVTIIEAMPEAGGNLVKFAAWTGLRSGELYALTWGDIDWNRKTCRVSKTLTDGKLKNTTKTYSSMRDVELLPSAIDALKAQKPFSFMKGKQIWLHPVSGQPFKNDKQFRESIWQGVLKKAGIRYRPPYQLRHTFASTLLSSGANPMWVAKQMGHADWGMIRKVYGKWIPQESSEVDRMATILGQNSTTSNNKTSANITHS